MQCVVRGDEKGEAQGILARLAEKLILTHSVLLDFCLIICSICLIVGDSRTGVGATSRCENGLV